MAINKVGIIGCGNMGLGMAHVMAEAGIQTIAIKATPGPTDRAQKSLKGSLDKLVERGKMEAAKRDSILGLIRFSDKEAEVADCDLVIESIVEDLQAKLDLFRRLEAITRPEAILATNTSTLSVTALMAVCKYRKRIAGLHFFNPAPTMKLVEVIHAFETSDETIETLRALCKKVGKDPVIVQDTTGFIVNRLLTPYMLSAIRLLEMGTGTIENIDHAMMSGAGHPMGPFALADYIGLDVVKAMAENIYADMHQPHVSVPHTLERLVLLGYLGRKTGRGFYDYSVKPAVQNPDLRRPVA